MTRRGCRCLSGCLASVLAVASGTIGVALWPAISEAVPQARREVAHDLATLRHDLQLPSSPSQLPSAAAPWPSATSAPSQSSPQVGWIVPSAAACEWGTATLALDRTLDLQAVGSYRQSASWYQKTAGWWQQARIDLTGLCGAAPVPTATVCDSDLAHFAEAYQIHSAAVLTDTELAERLWDQTWASNYQRLERIWLGARCGAGGG